MQGSPSRAAVAPASGAGRRWFGAGAASALLSAGWLPLGCALGAFAFTLLRESAQIHAPARFQMLPTELGLALLLRYGPRILPGYVAGTFSALILLGLPLPAALFGAVAGAGIVALAWPLCGGSPPGAGLFAMGSGVARYLLAIVPVVALAHGVVAWLGAAWFAEGPLTDGLEVVSDVLRREVVSLVLVVPALVLLRRPTAPIPIAQILEGIALVAAAVLSFRWEFASYLWGAPVFSPVALLPVPLVMWSALRSGPVLTTLVMLGFALGATWGLAEAGGVPSAHFSEFQLAFPFLYLIGLGAITLLMLAVRTEQSDLASSEGRFRYLVESLNLIPWEARAGRDSLTWVGPQASRLLGYSREEWLEPGFWVRTIVDEDREQTVALCAEMVCTHDHYAFEYRMHAADGRVVWIEDFVSVDRGAEGGAQLRGVFLDITERKEQELALKAAERQAQAASRAKNDFLAVMNHELRTPLNAVVLGTELLLESPLDGAQRAHAETIRRCSSVLLEQICATLDLSSIEAGHMRLAPVLVDMEGFLADIESIMRPLAEERGLRFSIDAEDTPPAGLVVDRRRLRQVLLNLLGNAVKFTEEGEVGLRLRVQRRLGADVELQLDVIDTGVGVPPSERSRIFEPFEQVDGTATRRHGGAGLGLTISRRLATLMGGELSYLPGEAGGSCFRLEVPVRLAEADMRGEPLPEVG